MRGTAHLDKNLDFAHDKNIGYTTSILKDLGVLDFKIKFAPMNYKFYRFRFNPEVILRRFNIECIEDRYSDGELRLDGVLILQSKA